MFFNLLLSTIIGLLAVYQSPAVETEDACESLFRAAQTGDLHLLEECFDNHPHIASLLNECTDEQGSSILSTAVAHHQTEIASKIVNHKDFKLKKNRQYDLKNHHERVWPKTDKRIAIKGSNALPLNLFKQAASIVEEMLEGRQDILSILNQEDNYILIHDDNLPWDKAPDREGEFKLPWDGDLQAGKMSPERGYIMVRQKCLETPVNSLTHTTLVHEIAHAIHQVALDDLDPAFDQKLKDLYDAAMVKGLWKNKYASKNHYEYWAEGVAKFFVLEQNSFLKDYDEKLFDLIDSIFIRKRLTVDLLQFHHGEPPLIRALNIQDTDVMLDVMNEMLALNETDVNEHNICMGCHSSWIYSPIVRAIKLNKIEAFKLLLQHPNIDLNERNHYSTVLLQAIHENIKDKKTLLEIMSMLLDHPKMDWSWMPQEHFDEFKNFFQNTVV